MLVVGDALVSQTELSTPVDLFEEDGFEGWVELLSHVLNQYPLTMLDSELKTPQQVAIAHLEDVEADGCCVSTEELDELIGLVLWVDHEWPPS